MDQKAKFMEMKAKADAEAEKRKKKRLFENFTRRNDFEIQKNTAMTDHAVRKMEDGSLKHISSIHNRPAEVLVKRRGFNVKAQEETLKRLLKEIYVEEKAKEKDRGRSR